jgi:hypothetical protein
MAGEKRTFCIAMTSRSGTRVRISARDRALRPCLLASMSRTVAKE